MIKELLDKRKKDIMAGYAEKELFLLLVQRIEFHYSSNGDTRFWVLISNWGQRYNSVGDLRFCFLFPNTMKCIFLSMCEAQWGHVFRTIQSPQNAIKFTSRYQQLSRSNPGILPLRQACRERDRLPCWPLYSQQVSHQRWIWGIACRQESMQVRNLP